MTVGEPDVKHYDQKPRRRAQFVNPPNTLKSKVGAGGLSEAIIQKAQVLLEKNTMDFVPLAELYLTSLMRGIERARTAEDLIEKKESESLIAGMLYPAIQLKANGGMFRYSLITIIADRLVQYMEVIETPDTDALEIIMAFHTTLRAIVMGRITGDAGQHGQELIDALDDACRRYFIRHPENTSDYKQDFSEEF